MTKKKNSLADLDINCHRILWFLIISGGKIRFNRLFELLEQNGLINSKPTLSLHLNKHLVEKNLVIRDIKDAPSISYEINHRKFDLLGNKVDLVKFAKTKVDEEKKAFDAASIDGQIGFVLLEIEGRILRKLKLKAELRSTPVVSWEKSLELMLVSNSKFHEDWLLEKCEKDKVYRQKVLEKIDLLIKKFEEKYCDKSKDLEKLLFSL